MQSSHLLSGTQVPDSYVVILNSLIDESEGVGDAHVLLNNFGLHLDALLTVVFYAYFEESSWISDKWYRNFSDNYINNWLAETTRFDGSKITEQECILLYTAFFHATFYLYHSLYHELDKRIKAYKTFFDGVETYSVGKSVYARIYFTQPNNRINR